MIWVSSRVVVGAWAKEKETKVTTWIGLVDYLIEENPDRYLAGYFPCLVPDLVLDSP